VTGSGAGRRVGGSRARRTGAALAALACLGAWTLAAATPANADELRAREWPLTFLDAAQANRLSTGSGITVGLLDTGVVGSRADLTGQVTDGPDYAGGVEKPGGPGWGEHGTCMASIIAGHGRGSGAGMLGIAPKAHILSVRVIRDDDAPDIGGATKDATPISDGIHYAVDHGAEVISMSLGGDEEGAGSDSSSEADAIRYALSKNVVVVVAAGNTDGQGDAIQYPGAERGVITVAAVTSSGAHAPFSTTGWDVSVAAPGANLPCDAADSDQEYELGDGTSQATAYVAGIAALIKSENRSLSPAQVRDILEKTTVDKPSGGRDDLVGFGVVDPVAALRLAAATKPAAEQPAPGAGPAGGYFGYGPAQVVAEAAPSFGPMSRALTGGAALLLLTAGCGFAALRRSARRAAADSAAIVVEEFIARLPPDWLPPPHEWGDRQ
jgi:type VII secretion-associated serine protease mycosin